MNRQQRKEQLLHPIINRNYLPIYETGTENVLPIIGIDGFFATINKGCDSARSLHAGLSAIPSSPFSHRIPQ